MIRRLLGGPLLFPLLVLALLVVAVAFAVTGTSSGALWKYLYGEQPDPRLLFGRPRAVRSDEWLVTTPLLVSQAAQGFPRINEALAGGVDVSLVYDVPYLDWSLLFRPHHWGFGVLPLEQAFALRWWGLAAVLLLSTYALVLQLLPGRRLLAAAAGLGLLLAPYTQWWFTSAVAPLAWSTAAVAALVWLLHADTRRRLAVRALVLAYPLAALGMVVYPPYVVPCALVVAAWGTGHLLLLLPDWSRQRRLETVGALAGAAVAAAGVVGAFLLTRWDVVQALRATDYPGERVEASGGFAVERLLYGPFTPNLRRAEASAPGTLDALGGNQSEASTFVLLGLLVVVLHGWLLVRARRQGLRPNPVVIALLVVALLFLAHLLVGVASPLTRAVGLHLVPHERLALGLGLLSTLLLVAAAWEVHRQQAADLRVPAALTGVAVLAVLVPLGLRVDDLSPIGGGGTAAVLAASVVVAGLAALFAGGRTTAAVVGLAAFCGVASFDVNPLYRGLFDLRGTPVGEAVARAQDAEPGGAWASISGLLSSPVLVEAGVPTFSAAFAYPVAGAWTELDPDGRYRTVYNRYGQVVFAPELTGAPLQNPQPDIVAVRFAACDRFAQERLAHVLAPRPSDDPCLRLREQVALPRQEFFVYEVVPPAG